MTEEVADSPEAEVVETEIVEESGIDLDSAQDAVSESLGFGKPEEKDEEVDTGQEDDKKPVEKADKEEKKEEKAEKEEKEPVKPTKDAPQSWKKEYREFFNSADPALQDYILTRESQMVEGLEKDRGDANLGRTMRDIITPFEASLKGKGIEAPQAVQFLLGAHNTLSNGTVEAKQAALQKLAQSYGIGAPAEGVNPELTTIQQELASIKQNMNASHQRTQQELETRVSAEVSAFAEDHPLFDDLQDDIAKFISAGQGLEEAYESAKWANPVTRQKELDKQAEEKVIELDKVRKKEADEAKKAKSVNVRGRDTNKAPTAPTGTMLDTMHETYREIKSRNK